MTWAVIAENDQNPSQKEEIVSNQPCWKRQTRFISLVISDKKLSIQRLDEKDEERQNMRVVGGCLAGHTPWYVYLQIEGEC